jgi:hypothetical protein
VNASPFRALSVEPTREIARVAALPRRAWSDDAAAALADMLTRELKTPGGTMRLRPVQAIALYEAMEARGLFGPIRVGGGKTLLTLLLPVVLEAKRPILLLPAALIEKTWRDVQALKEHWRLATNVQMLSYEMLGLVQSAEKLKYIEPDLIIADEAHYLKNLRAGRTRRVARYMNGCPETCFVGVSGTVMKSSIKDFAHILRWALKQDAPVPVSDDEVSAWADALDDKVNPLGRRAPGALLALDPTLPQEEPAIVTRDTPRGLLVDVATMRRDSLARARQVFQKRLLETRGVVASPRSDGVTCSLRVSALEYEPAPVIAEHFETLRRRSETPCGKSFAEAAEMRMYARELALGFSYTWIPKEKVAEWDALVRQSKNVVPQKEINAGVKLIQKRAEPDRGLGTRGTEKRSSKELLPGTMATDEKSTSSSTESRSLSMKRWLRSTADAVTSATVKSENKVISQSIIATRQERSGEFSARSATEASGYSGTMPLGLSVPLRTFLEQNRPPPDWLQARREWCSFVRETIEESQSFDTMLQVANACRAGLLPSEKLSAWKVIETSYEPTTRPIFYDVTALDTCLRWLSENVGIVWVEHQAFGTALSQLSGLPYFGAGGLDASGVSIVNEKGDRSIIASVAACGQGFNLQMFCRNLVTSCPSGAATIEQVLGRTHRDGQEADEVTADVLLGCGEHYDAFFQALGGARAAQDTLGHSQKLLLADILIPNINDKKGPLWG